MPNGGLQPGRELEPLAIIAFAETGIAEIPTGGGVIEVNFRTGEIKWKTPEMEGREPFGPGLKALGPEINTWHAAKGVKGLEEVHIQAGRLLVSTVKAVVEAAAKMSGSTIPH